ncbi:formamidopyrimidine-dna glycosylase [Moniliophthora roreri MCA 2997]|uniref:Formamidopyrimidine-dna glycosylase n=1 Tax=Moniliophthora roreri (strain MCA 2997) TaxID=1381753 RepID=V2XRR8_MONRO|nr:formamidopyrimidine-dna glycosylase [Moniliophthora roreri MCA 2997]
MPELPEVERAAKLIKHVGLGKKIQRVEATEDTIVFSDITAEEFTAELTGRQITDVKRYGKIFYIELDGTGRMPVLHFGMTGMLQVRGELAMYYKETPRKASTDWPPRFMKFTLHLLDEETDTTTEIAFLDARRLGRIRLRNSPATEPPISELGFDPILSMPKLDDFSELVLKRSCPIKALLLDQSFSAGIGNWVADEILYHSRVHPEQRSNTLSMEQLTSLHQHMQNVCQTAIAVDADDSKFPENWLFKHRWGKGKGKSKGGDGLKLVPISRYFVSDCCRNSMQPDGTLATIQWVTVGGRTSAYVSELQHMPPDIKPLGKRGRRSRSKTDAEEAEESDLTPLEDDEVLSEPKKRKQKILTVKQTTVTRRRIVKNTPEDSQNTLPVKTS